MTPFSTLEKSLLAREAKSADKSLDVECGAWASALREKRGLSTQEVADLVGASRTFVNYLEHGKKPWSSKWLRKFKEVLG